MTRRTTFAGRSIAALAASGVVLSAALSGCGAGQVSQTATQEPAINGVNGNLGELALRNVHIFATQTSAAIQPGRDVELVFVVTNQSADTGDKLVSVTSDIGSVQLTGSKDVPAGGTLVIGTPDGQPTPLEAVEPADSGKATVKLSQPITNGLTYDFVFSFERAGEAKLAVPVSAGEAPRRDSPGESGGGSHSGGH
ncbi:hypothetical protein [Mycobacterium sp. SMC-4]|uniref:hypothetical protein n=1 Tax=Mycobacterium sp. SMC-4 TaxID=2857059 RepID=UPI003D093CC5